MSGAAPGGHPGQQCGVTVCAKWVDLRPEIDPVTGAIGNDVRRYGFSEADQAALEVGLRLATARGTGVRLVCAAPPAAEGALRELAASGAKLFPLSATTPEELRRTAGRLADWIESQTDEDSETDLSDLAYTLARRRAHRPVRTVVLANDRAELVAELSDDQSPPVHARYEAQLKKTPLYSYKAKLVKLGDRIANMRDILFCPMPDWTQERLFGNYRQARKQVDLLSGTHPILEKLFDAEYLKAEKIMQENSA